MSKDPGTKVLRISVFHRMSGGSGSNSAFEALNGDHAGAITEALLWLGTLAEAHGCTDAAQAAFMRGVEARRRCEAQLAEAP